MYLICFDVLKLALDAKSIDPMRLGVFKLYAVGLMGPTVGPCQGVIT